jgi:lipopolysaccharide transport system ATP-binding protein
LSESPAIRFTHVTKDYWPDTMATRGLKNFLLHLPHVLRDHRKRRAFRALDDVSFEVARGECLGIIGRNGSGKSTTLGLTAGVFRVTGGQVETQGRICPLLELGAGFHPQLSGLDNIVMNGVLLGLTRAEVQERLDDIIAFSELGDFVHRQLREYSSGMVARLGFSVAVHVQPDILLIDEVLAVGDEGFQQKCLAKMEEFRAKKVTMMFVTHNLREAAIVCDRIALLEKGRIVAIGEPDAVIAEYEERTSRRSGA